MVTTTKTTTKTSEETEDQKAVTKVTQMPSVVTPSPLTFPAEVLAEASKGVKRDNIENDFFDPSFYKNQVKFFIIHTSFSTADLQIAMRQHNPQMRPKNRDVITDINVGDESDVIRVIAKEVQPGGDKLCKITIKQSTFLGAGAFSGMSPTSSEL